MKTAAPAANDIASMKAKANGAIPYSNGASNGATNGATNGYDSFIH